MSKFKSLHQLIVRLGERDTDTQMHKWCQTITSSADAGWNNYSLLSYLRYYTVMETSVSLETHSQNALLQYENSDADLREVGWFHMKPSCSGTWQHDCLTVHSCNSGNSGGKNGSANQGYFVVRRPANIVLLQTKGLKFNSQMKMMRCLNPTTL